MNHKRLLLIFLCCLTVASAWANPIISVSNVTQSEGNFGTNTFSLTVSLSTPAGAGSYITNS